MSNNSSFSKNIKNALVNSPPGEWMSTIPEECIRLNSGYPAPTLVPSEGIKAAVNRLIDEEKDLPLHYIGSPQISRLKEQIQTRLNERDIYIKSDELLITSGACQAIDLIARIFIDEETVVAIESPTYMEALEIFKNYTSQFISIPVDHHGLQTDRLEEVLQERRENGLTIPKLLYTIPTFHNPTGTTMSMDRRQHVLELATKYNFFIVEDDAYGELNFHKPPVPLMSLDKNNLVIHVGSLSKVVAPGMRIGWVAGPSELISALAWFKKDLDHPFAQATMANFIEREDFDKRLTSLREVYGEKCKVMISALEKYFPESASWYIPAGGYFVWVKVQGVDTEVLLKQALSKGVAYVPGKYFFYDPHVGTEYLRLSFSYADENEIRKGIKLLGKIIKP
ncbi:PLP-dependent aminotransferase family protein [Bacillus luteolus]|uniref:PLP-dependent aminotransferase family protein n=1 Tax=Litchfieldia luteola TaxID=682179 RepID=A0ABR9QH73_9BACI|nr:PLP-dependent aminotransferase family protein [Cytobacillus luteolus]MBE4907839.1 PLP-dependent aminotransferase family protein [Cytobacillus luteolus]MBP1944004.1 2-aminoadipate transaminase [Cytobacillus luteolus]